MRRIYLRDCAPGDVVEDVYVVTNKQFSASATGKYFIKAFVSDRTAQLTARMWNATRDLFNAMPDSGFARVRGRIENYQNNLQFIIEHFGPAKEGSFEAGDLMPQTEKNIGRMCAKLSEILGSLQNRHLAALVQAYLDDEKLMADFCKAPAAMTFHHAFLGGLLEHTLNAIEVAEAAVKFYPGLNRDLVVAGIFLHDIAKTWELSYDCSFGYTDAGQLVGHVVKSAMWVEHKAAAAGKIIGEKIPQPLIDVIQHIILSHHGLPEHGAARVPSTPEAIFVHTIENLDAKMMMALGATRGEGGRAGAEGNWTEYMKAFGGRLYRPDVAPADAVESEPAEEPAPMTEAATSRAPTADRRLPLPPSNGNAASGDPGKGPLPPLKLALNNPLFESGAPKNR